MAETFTPQVGEDGKLNTRNSLTGLLARLTPDQISTNPDYLEVVPDDAKPYEPGLFRPGKVGEFDNPEPPTDAVLNAEAELEATLADNAPNSKVAREARQAVKDAEAEAEAARLEAEKVTENLDQASAGSNAPQGD
jgi:hypothetical protein